MDSLVVNVAVFSDQLVHGRDLHVYHLLLLNHDAVALLLQVAFLKATVHVQLDHAQRLSAHPEVWIRFSLGEMTLVLLDDSEVDLASSVAFLRVEDRDVAQRAMDWLLAFELVKGPDRKQVASLRVVLHEPCTKLISHERPWIPLKLP